MDNKGPIINYTPLMLPGFNNWKNDIYMSLGKEGFTGTMDKEEFTTDELDQLNAIISEEESQDIKTEMTSPMENKKEPEPVKKELTRKQAKGPETTKPVNPAQDNIEEEEPELEPTQNNIDEEEPELEKSSVVTREGFSGSQSGLMTYIGRLLIVIILTAGSVLINMKQTATLLNRFISADKLIYVQIGLFALFAYVILTVSRQ